MTETSAPGRLLGIDFGTKRIGFALSDELGWSAEPLLVWHRTTLEEDLEHVRRLVTEHEVGAIVIGLPYHMDGREGASLERARVFIDALTAALPLLPVHMRDETLTTFEAEERMKASGLSPAEAKAQVDAFAAAVILEEFLRARGSWVEPESEPSRPARRGRKR